MKAKLLSQDIPNTAAVTARKMGVCLPKGTCKHSMCYAES